jgi:hypothetical protein
MARALRRLYLPREKVLLGSDRIIESALALFFHQTKSKNRNKTTPRAVTRNE